MSQLLQYYKSFQPQPRTSTPNLQPTFEDLTIDDNLTELQRVVRYARSAIGLQRLVHVKMLSSVAKSVGFAETGALILPLVEELGGNEPEPVVRQHLLEQISLLAQFCHSAGGEDGYKIVVDKLLPLTARLLEDEKAEVRQSACAALVVIAKLIRTDDLGQHVLTIILRLSHEDDNEEKRMVAAELLNSLAESLGQDLCKQFVIPEVVCLAEDPVFRVRKSTALNFHNICKVGGEHELFERLMPAFVRLSKDDMYRVRRACAQSLSEISKHVSDDIRVGVLLEIYLRLTQDPSKLVKQSILQQSGTFISSLPPKAVNEMVLGHFCSMASGPTGDISVDAELRHYCAYSFPAVLQTLGVERWNEVRELYHSLVQCRSANVKQTLAASLHEIARILSEGVRPALVEEELVPVFESMIQDVESVQMGVIKRLADFLSMLSEPCRISYLPLLHDILHSTNPFNWRLRQHLATQLPELISLPPKNQVFMTLFPLMMTLLQDPVASVRRESFRGVAKMMMVLVQLVEETEGGGGGGGAAKKKRPTATTTNNNVNNTANNNTVNGSTNSNNNTDETVTTSSVESSTAAGGSNNNGSIVGTGSTSSEQGASNSESHSSETSSVAAAAAESDQQTGNTHPDTTTSSSSTAASIEEQSITNNTAANNNNDNNNLSESANADVAVKQEEEVEGSAPAPVVSDTISASVQLEVLTNSINQLAASETYQVRQLWVELVHCLLRELPRGPFEKFFADGLSLMAKDKVSNVRVALSRLLTGWTEEAGDISAAPWEEEGEEDGSSALTSQLQDEQRGEEGSSDHGSTAAAAANNSNKNTSSGSSSSGSRGGGGGVEKKQQHRPSPWYWLLRRPDIQDCVHTLARDEVDVYFSMQKLQPMFPDLVFEAVERCRKEELPHIDSSSSFGVGVEGGVVGGGGGICESAAGDPSANTLPPLGVPLPIMSMEMDEDEDGRTAAGDRPRSPIKGGSIFDALAHGDGNTDEGLLRLEDIADTGFFPHRTPPGTGSGRSSRSSSFNGSGGSPLVMPLSLPMSPSPLHLMESPIQPKYDDDEKEEDGEEDDDEEEEEDESSEEEEEDGSEGDDADDDKIVGDGRDGDEVTKDDEEDRHSRVEYDAVADAAVGISVAAVADTDRSNSDTTPLSHTTNT